MTTKSARLILPPSRLPWFIFMWARCCCKPSDFLSNDPGSNPVCNFRKAKCLGVFSPAKGSRRGAPSYKSVAVDYKCCRSLLNAYPARLAEAAILRSACTDVHESVLALLPREAVDSRRAGEPQRLETGPISQIRGLLVNGPFTNCDLTTGKIVRSLMHVANA